MRRLVPLLVLLACGRDLTLPPLLQPPRIDSVTPAQGFAGDTVTIAGVNLADPTAQVAFDLRPATILTPPGQRDGRSLVVEVPQDVLGASVTVTTAQGTAKAPQPFTWLGLGHPRTVALRATLALGPDVENVAPLPGGDFAAVLDQRYGTVRGLDSGGGLTAPAHVGQKPTRAFGPAAGAWVLDASDAEQTAVQQVDLTQDPPVLGARVAVDGVMAAADGSPSGALFAAPSDHTILLYALPSGTLTRIDASAAGRVAALRFWGNGAIVGVGDGAPFLVDLGGAAPTVHAGAAWASGGGPDYLPALAVDAPARGQLAFTSHDQVLLLTWSGAAAPPVLSPTPILSHLFPQMLAFNLDGSKVLVGDSEEGIVGLCDPATGAIVSAQPLPGLASLALATSGGNQGLLQAATGDGVALLFGDGRLLRRNPMSVGANNLAVDPVCGDALLATDYGPLRISRATLTPSIVDSSLHLTSVSSGEGGLLGWLGNDLYAYHPPADCKAGGSFAHIAASPDEVIHAALSADGKWVASAGFQTLDLLPREDAGAGLSAQRIDFATASVIEVAWAGGQLTAAHPDGAGGYALTTWQSGGLAGAVSLPLQNPGLGLRHVRFADAWMIDQNLFDGAGNFIATRVTVWSAAQGVVATSDVPASVTVPSGVSADGFMLVGISYVGVQAGLDTLLLQLDQGRLLQLPGPHVDLSAQPTDVMPSPDGSRFYALLPLISSVAVVE